jgi:CheY-like chemotaxis protein
MLPGMDGMAALKQFRDSLGIPVIFLTARRRELDQVLGLELGADDYITKPAIDAINDVSAFLALSHNRNSFVSVPILPKHLCSLTDSLLDKFLPHGIPLTVLVPFLITSNILKFNGIALC